MKIKGDGYEEGTRWKKNGTFWELEKKKKKKTPAYVATGN